MSKIVLLLLALVFTVGLFVSCRASDTIVLAPPLTITDEDALRHQVYQCWNVPMSAVNAADLIVQLSVDINPDRTVQHVEVVDQKRMETDPYFRAAAESAMRALTNPKCSPLVLPPEKYQTWKHLNFSFNPKDVL
ncbi:MAG TPA: cell envelope integrity protein TolA [Alphaproteobacteria bacterium]|nr:cell envelope integrity protein TolA [Alphaproteobacteria bacterium]